MLPVLNVYIHVHVLIHILVHVHVNVAELGNLDEFVYLVKSGDVDRGNGQFIFFSLH